jgi:TatD DNase family protein
MQLLLPFDAHNHIHMGPTPPMEALGFDNPHHQLSGCAVMSTCPEDYQPVLQLCQEISETHPDTTMIPCLGVHPWFVHTLTDEDWEISNPNSANSINNDNPHSHPPRWIQELETLLDQHPTIPVGEIGLDNFHFDFDSKELVCPMDTQIQAFEWQLELATKLQRPVSVHCVQAMGPLMTSIGNVKKRHQKLPPAIYFHAFGGKPMSVDQLAALCHCRKANPPTKVYFGLAPVINFGLPKTADVIRRVGLDRIVLETDHEDAALVPAAMQQGVAFLAETLGVSWLELVARANQNAMALYGILP